MGVSLSTVTRAINGERKDLPWLTAILIHYHSDGFYPCWQLLPDLFTEGQIPPALADLQAHQGLREAS